MRVTSQLRAVMVALGSGPTYGLQIMRVTNLTSGTVYPILRRLEAEGLIEREGSQQSEPWRPASRGYRLTTAGEAWLAEQTDPGK